MQHQSPIADPNEKSFRRERSRCMVLLLAPQQKRGATPTHSIHWLHSPEALLEFSPATQFLRDLFALSLNSPHPRFLLSHSFLDTSPHPCYLLMTETTREGSQACLGNLGPSSDLCSGLHNSVERCSEKRSSSVTWIKISNI